MTSDYLLAIPPDAPARLDKVIGGTADWPEVHAVVDLVMSWRRPKSELYPEPQPVGTQYREDELPAGPATADVQGRTIETRAAGLLGRLEADRLDQPLGRGNLVRVTIRGYRVIELLLAPAAAEQWSDELRAAVRQARKAENDQ